MKKAKILIVFAMFAVFLFCVGGCKQMLIIKYRMIK